VPCQERTRVNWQERLTEVNLGSDDPAVPATCKLDDTVDSTNPQQDGCKEESERSGLDLAGEDTTAGGSEGLATLVCDSSILELATEGPVGQVAPEEFGCDEEEDRDNGYQFRCQSLD
jgi:hypothetical protein